MEDQQKPALSRLLGRQQILWKKRSALSVHLGGAAAAGVADAASYLLMLLVLLQFPQLPLMPLLLLRWLLLLSVFPGFFPCSSAVIPYSIRPLL